jgi:2-amino-4-hydroxy-6-hydroxymethyldihydropteridine diphosphokinase
VQNESTNHVFLLLGTNLGDRFENLLVARNHVAITTGKIITESSIYETAAWGKTDQGPFLNQVIEIETDSTPTALLAQLLSIESIMGRVREEKWGPRLIDLDILLYDEIIVQSESLTIPHPALHRRRFTLIPLAEIAANIVHPVLQKSIATLLKECSDDSAVHRLPL